MTKYKLVNEDRGVEICEMLDKVISNSKFYNAFEKLPNFISKPISMLSRNAKEHLLFKKWVTFTVKNIYSNPSISLNHYLADEYLSIDEAIFCIMGLNPRVIEWIDANPRKSANKEITSLLLKQFIMQTSEGRGLYKAPKIIEPGGFISEDGSKVYTNGLAAWAIEKGFIEEVIKNEDNQITKPEKLVSGVYERDPETEIPLHRLKIYKETLPSYLESLEQPIAERALGTPDDVKDGEYTKLIKSRLGVGGSTTKKEIPKLINKSSWWKSQPQSIRNKIKKRK